MSARFVLKDAKFQLEAEGVAQGYGGENILKPHSCLCLRKRQDCTDIKTGSYSQIDVFIKNKIALYYNQVLNLHNPVINNNFGEPHNQFFIRFAPICLMAFLVTWVTWVESE